MKKIIRILGITLSLVILASCDKGDNGEDNSLPEVNPNTLAGTYKVSIAMVDTAVDSNKDGFSSQDLLLEGYNACGFDDGIEITFEANKLELAKFCYDKTIDKNNYYTLYNDFAFSNYSTQLDKYINSR